MNFRYLSYSKFFSLMLLAAAGCIVSSAALGSSQYWPSAGVVWDINGPWMLQYKETYYYHVEDSASNQAKSDISAVYKGADNIYDVGLGFAYLDGGSQTKQEERPYLLTTLRSKILDRDVANRFMIEYRGLSDSSDYWRFRDKVTLNSSFDNLDTRGIRLLNRERFRPYIADEVFFSSNGQGFSQNRTYLGLQIKIVENIGANVYYLYQSVENSSNQWNNNNIIGMDITFSF